MKSFVVLKRTGMIFSVLALFLALLFSSCDNVSGGGSQAAVLPVVPQATPAASSQLRAIVTFCGSVGVSGALPQEVAAKVSALAQSVAAPASTSENSPEVSRSARPDLNPTDYYYYVSADPQDSSGNAPVYYGKDDQGKFVGGSSGVSYEIGLPVGSWIIECGLKSAATDKPVLRASSGLITLTESDSVVSKSFTAVPVSDAGNGSVLLVINKGSASACQNGSATYKNAAGENVVVALVPASMIDSSYGTDVLALKLDDIAPGAYDMTISFYDENGVMLYQTVQTVGVFSGMKTNSWVTDGGTDSETGLITGDGFTINAAAVAVFKSSVFYVGDTGATVPGYRGPDDYNEGTFLAPFASLQKAVDTISVLGDGSTDYKIYVSGTLEGTTNFQSAALNNKAKSIAIEGMDSSAKLCRGNSDVYNVLSVTSTVPVSIKNIQIVAKAGDTNSRGIYIDALGSSVTLLEGTVVSGHTYGPGAGVYDYQGKLYVKGATISGNNASSGANKVGGGVCVANGGVMEMTSGEISGNTADDKGGAVYVEGVFTIGGSASIPLGSSNDVYLYDSKTIDVGPLGGSGVVATITPFSWARNASVLKATSSIGGTMTPEICGRFAINSEGFSIKKSKVPATQNLGVLAADIFVAPDGDDGVGVEGTKQHPFKSLARAIEELSGGEPETIWVNGTLTANDASELQRIPATLKDGTTAFDTNRCSALTIKGYDSATTYNGVIDANSKGTALTVATSVPVTIENLKITGGKATNGGGGITVSAGSVTLSDRAWITKNIGEGNSYCAGGARVDSGAKLFMRGTALIGNKVTSAPTSKEYCLAAGGNMCESSSEGGGILNSGSTFIGCDEDGNAGDAFKLAEGYGVMGNWALQYGGGICNKGILKIGSGEVSFNMADNQTVNYNPLNPSSSTGTGGGIYQVGSAELFICGGKIRGNKAVTGGGVCISSGSAQMSGGTIGGSDSGDGNVANLSGRSVNGGGVYIGSSGSLEMTGGTVLGNSASGNGGAVYVYGTFAMSGVPNIPLDSEKKNDVYLASGKTISVGNFDATALDPVATITLFEWKRKTNFLTSSNFITTQTSKFNFTQDNDGWERVIDSTASYKAAYINSPIYVVDANDPSGSGKTRPDGFNPGVASGATGTKTSPYASVAAALGCSDLSLADNTITVAGTLKGAQTISGTSVPSELSLKGYKAAGAATSSAKIDAGGGTSAGSALTVDADGKTVTIQDLTITGGNAENGGGINLAAGTVTLTNGANIVGNQATNGGGVYLAGSGSTLYMKGTSVIGDKNEYTASGNTINLNPTSQTGSGCANKADNGGGIYCNGGNVYVGCDNSGLNTTISLATAGGLRRNYAGNGGGVYIAGGTFMTASGQISYNWASSGAGVYVADGAGHKIAGTVDINNNKAGNEGGGLYIGSGSTVSMSGSSKIEKNNAVSGGGVSLLGTLNMSAGTIGGDSPDLGNTSSSSGGGVNIGVGSSSPYPCGTFNMSGGTISYNSCSNNGGGVSIGSRTPSSTTYNGTFSMSGGIISNNTASAKGGAVLQFGKFNISGSASIPYGVTIDGTTTKSPKYNDVYLFKDTNTITVASASLSGGASVATVTPTAWKRGTNIIDWGVSATDAQKTTIKGQIKLSQDDSGWERDDITSGGKNYTYITSPIYVADATYPLSGFGAGKTKANGGNGTKSSPYDSIAEALKDTDLASVKKIKIAGTVKGAQTISGTLSTDTLTIEGYTDGGVTSSLNGGFSSTSSTKGRPLTVSSAATVTIQNLAITGGYASGSTSASKMGGGIFVASGAAVNLADGAVVKGNHADNEGGGVYVESGAYFAAYGTSVIGDSSATAPQFYPGVDANQAKYGAGIYSQGTLCFGKSINKSGTESGTASWTGGLLGNTAFTSDGGAIWTSGATNLYDGNIKFNYSMGNGGAIYIAENTSSVTMSGGTIFKNTAYDNGGAVYISSGATFNMSGGTMGGKDASNNDLPNKVTNYSGGAIYQGGTFNISGTAYIYPGDKKTNDVYLAGDGTIEGGKTVNVTATWNGSQSDSSPMSITPSELKRGRIVLGGSKYASNSNYKKFAVTTTEWSVGFDQGTWTLDDDLKKRIGADLWVAGKGKNGNSVTLSEGVGDPSDDNLGTKSAPYASIKKAIQQCWTMDRYFWINVDGTVYGKQQVVPAANTTAKSGLAKEFKIVGFTNSATIDRGLSDESATSEGSALKIETTTATVTLGTLKITGGNTTGEGGGIYSCKTAPTISLNDVEISGNTAAVNGGGIYFEGSSGTERLTLQTTATIKGNIASNYGGGVYIKNANMNMTAKALIGDNSAFATGATDSSKSNIADIGGGVYAATANVYIGYKYDSSNSKFVVDALTDGYGICHNYAKSTSLGGGGICISSGSAMYMGSGKISKNGTATYGGGIYNAGTLYLHTNALVGDARDSAATSEANSNTAKYGGGIYNSGTLYLGHNGTEDTSLSTGKGIVGNYASTQGGGLYNGATTAYIKSGYVKCNRAGTSDSALGGGIYVSNGTVEMSGGTIAQNTAGQGGGVYAAKKFTMSGGVIGDTSSNVTPLDTNPIKYSNYASNYGGGIFCTTGSTVSITGGTIQRNFANNGGGIYYSGGTFGLNGGSILYNATNASYGGGLYLASTSATLTSGTIKGNKSFKGGGIYTANASKTTINGALALESNSAVPRGNTSTQGGAIYNTGELTISGAATFASNTANGDQGSLAAATASGGAIFNSGTLIISGAVSMNSNSAKTKAGENKLTRGGAIYNSGELTMSKGSIGTTGLNTAGSQGGAIYQSGTFNASGSINFYNASNGDKNNDVFLATDKCVNVTGSFSATPTGGKVMAITLGTYGIGKTVATRDATNCTVTAFKTSVGKMGLVKSGIYSKVEVSQPIDNGIQGVVGIDFNAVRASDITNYMTGKPWTSASSGTAISYGLSYYFLKHTNGRIGILKLDRTKTNNNDKTGYINAERVFFASTGTTSAGTVSTYDQISYNTAEHYQESAMFPYAYNNGGNGWDVFNTSSLSLYNGNAVYIVQPVGEYSLAIQYLETSGGIGITGYKAQ